MRLVFNKINKDIFEMLRDGRKRIETRAATSKYQNIREGEPMTFSCAGETFEKIVSKISCFKSVEKLLDTYQPADINPLLKTKEEIIEMYHSFHGYKEKIREHGIIAMEFK